RVPIPPQRMTTFTLTPFWWDAGCGRERGARGGRPCGALAGSAPGAAGSVGRAPGGLARRYRLGGGPRWAALPPADYTGWRAGAARRRIASKLVLPGDGSLPHNSGYRRSEGMSVRQQSRHELVAAQRARYQRASRTAKAQILDEFVAATGYHRKHALRLFREGPPAPRVGHGGRP